MKNGGSPKDYYHISSVARMYNIHPQTLRLYEREGLLKPSRSEGNTRMYTRKDLERLELILNLVRDLGVNLAGVEVVLNMREKIEKVEQEVNEFLDYIRQEFFEGRETEFDIKSKSLIHIMPGKMVRLNSEEDKKADKKE
ncbi:MAG: helix-turn-helix transcriptional regulator [Candidatus Aminicenantes bacterium]|nr:helix-turn-helix transcriptional regulator [Candidatus Aminicenantes bacterium]